MAKPLILASGSPRRKELLQMVDLAFTVELPSRFKEFTGSEEPNPSQLVRKNAEGKAREVFKHHPEAVVLGVDTVVFCEGKVLEKPKNKADARQMLAFLQGKRHEVHTGHFLITQNKTAQVEDVTMVSFYPMTEDQIDRYIETGEPMDKAGAYAIQGKAAEFIHKIEGDFFGVMGLSVSKFLRLYKTIDPMAMSPVE